MMRVARRVGGVALLACCARGAWAQDVPLPAPAAELRVDVIAGRAPAAQAGAGVQFAVDYYARIGVVAAAGVRLDDVSPRADARIDLLARFLLDPLRQSRVGVSGGGGVGLRIEPGDRVRPVILLALDVEGSRGASGWVPALQIGTGDGVRIGVVLRRATPKFR